MPTYDYICDSCNHEFEAYESIKAQPLTECPECKLPSCAARSARVPRFCSRVRGFIRLIIAASRTRKPRKRKNHRMSRPNQRSDNRPPQPKSEPAKAAPAATKSEP